MTSSNDLVAKLEDWHKREYFAESEWDERGLIPSDPSVIKALESARVNLVDDLLEALPAGADQERLTLIALDHFKACLDSHFDTEEAEFLADCILEIANSIDLDDFVQRSEKLMMDRLG